MNDIIDKFFEYTKNTERTAQNTRWSIISCVAATLGRKVHFPFGHFNMYPNMYIFLVGLPASRKTRIIEIAEDVLRKSNYNKFAFKRTTREQFLLDFEMGFNNLNTDGTMNLDTMLDSWDPNSISKEAFICADEFLEFIGMKNYNFLTTLTTLFDCTNKNYEDRVKNSKSVSIQKPTVNILGGLTPTNLSLVLPEEMVGQGCTSRLILINSGKLEKKITFPLPPDQKVEQAIIEDLQALSKLSGSLSITPQATALLDEIYQTYVQLLDVRLQHYCSRRFSHLLKLLTVITCIKGQMTVDLECVIKANTLLSYAESQMHLALGEFGNSRNSKATQRVMEVLTESPEPIEVIELFAAVGNELDKMSTLIEILNNLEISNKIIKVSNHIALNRAMPSKNTIGIDYAKYIPEARGNENV